MLRRAKPYISQESLGYLYQSLIQPHFDSCSMVWRNCSITLQEKLQTPEQSSKNNNRGHVRSNEIFKKLKWETLEKRRDEQTLSYVTKALSNLCPENISEMFKLSNSDSYNLRSNNNKLMLSKPKTNSMKRTFGYAAARVWNNNTKDSLVQKQLHIVALNSLKNHFVNTQFYTEFFLHFSLFMHPFQCLQNVINILYLVQLYKQLNR